MKIFWQAVYPLNAAQTDTPSQPDLLAPASAEDASTSFDLEHLTLPLHAFCALHDALCTNETLLPLSARSFQQWRVSLLMRFADSECGVEPPGEEPAQPVEPFARREGVDIMDIPGIESLLE